MNSPEVHFSDRRLDEQLRSQLGGLTTKLSVLGDDLARERFGDAAFQNPTDILITPTPVETGEYFMVVGFSHQTSGSAPGVFQKHDTTVDIGSRGEEVYLECEEGRRYLPLTPREALFMHEVETASVVALVNDSHDPTE